MFPVTRMEPEASAIDAIRRSASASRRRPSSAATTRSSSWPARLLLEERLEVGVATERAEVAIAVAGGLDEAERAGARRLELFGAVGGNVAFQLAVDACEERGAGRDPP